VPADASEVVTSAQAAARVLRETYGEGARIVALGAAGLREGLTAAGLVPVGVQDEGVALATGYGPDVVWRDVMRAAVRLRDGLPWVASNTDHTIPTSFGVAPGHGVMVQMLAEFSGVRPVVAGKPERPLFDETIARTGARWPLMVGDRLDTDIEGATNAGIASLLVMTGVTELAHLVAAPPRLRPTYVSADLRGLLEAHEVPVRDGSGWRARGWTARVERGRLTVAGSGAPSDWWRAVAAAAWAAVDDTGHVPDVSGVRPPKASPEAGTLPA
jgi:glycerol 3-phosphatase-2